MNVGFVKLFPIRSCLTGLEFIIDYMFNECMDGSSVPRSFRGGGTGLEFIFLT